MPADIQPERRQAHELIDQLPDAQIIAIVGLLEAMLNPGAVRPDEEPVTDEDRKRLEAGRRWFAQRGGKGISMDDVLTDYDLKTDDFPLNK
jgi:hypothetical protein